MAAGSTLRGLLWMFFAYAGSIMFKMQAGMGDTVFAPIYQLLVRDYTTWGWIHLGLAALATLTGIGLLFGQTWARVIAVILCVVNVLASLVFAGAYPFWAVLLIAFSVITAYAIIAHGREVAEAYDI